MRSASALALLGPNHKVCSVPRERQVTCRRAFQVGYSVIHSSVELAGFIVMGGDAALAHNSAPLLSWEFQPHCHRRHLKGRTGCSPVAWIASSEASRKPGRQPLQCYLSAGASRLGEGQKPGWLPLVCPTRPQGYGTNLRILGSRSRDWRTFANKVGRRFHESDCVGNIMVRPC